MASAAPSCRKAATAVKPGSFWSSTTTSRGLGRPVTRSRGSVFAAARTTSTRRIGTSERSTWRSSREERAQGGQLDSNPVPMGQANEVGAGPWTGRATLVGFRRVPFQDTTFRSKSFGSSAGTRSVSRARAHRLGDSDVGHRSLLSTHFPLRSAGGAAEAAPRSRVTDSGDPGCAYRNGSNDSGDSREKALDKTRFSGNDPRHVLLVSAAERPDYRHERRARVRVRPRPHADR
jgi:hypothetical protein